MHAPRHYPLHLIIVPIMELALMLAIAAYIATIDMNLLYLLSIPLGASIAYFLSPRTIEDYYDNDYTKYEQSIALMASNLLCLMIITYYNVPVFVAIARQKYRLDVLMYDDDEDVRAVVAELGYGLDVLINDNSEFVRLTAQEKLDDITKAKTSS